MVTVTKCTKCTRETVNVERVMDRDDLSINNVIDVMNFSFKVSIFEHKTLQKIFGPGKLKMCPAGYEQIMNRIN